MAINPVIGLKIMYIDIDSIDPCPNSKRHDFDCRELIQLSRSIKNYGMLQPVSVRKNGGRYELVAGERRIRAARMAGFTKIPAIVSSMREETAATYAVIENTHRIPLTYFDEAEGYLSIIRRFGFTKDELAKKLGLSREYLEKKIALLGFSENIRKEILKKGISEAAACAIAEVSDEQLQLELIEIIAEKGYGDEKAKRYITEVIYDAGHKEHAIRKQMVKNAKVYVNTIKRTVDMMKKAGLVAQAVKNENDEYIEYVIKIAK